MFTYITFALYLTLLHASRLGFKGKVTLHLATVNTKRATSSGEATSVGIYTVSTLAPVYYTWLKSLLFGVVVVWRVCFVDGVRGEQAGNDCRPDSVRVQSVVCEASYRQSTTRIAVRAPCWNPCNLPAITCPL